MLPTEKSLYIWDMLIDSLLTQLEKMYNNLIHLYIFFLLVYNTTAEFLSS
jgi:hypothetical protein